MKSPYAVFSDLSQHSTKWTRGFWKERFDVVINSIAPNIYRLFSDSEISHCIANFRIAAGLEQGEHSGPAFQDGDFFKWLEGASYLLGATHDAELKKVVDESIALIGKAMRSDGYIFTKRLIADLHGESNGWGAMTDSLNFEVYNMGHLITAGCVHYRATGEKSLLNLAEKAASYLHGVFTSEIGGTAKTSICPSHYMALIELYETTGKSLYLETARIAIQLRDSVQDGTDDNQDRYPLRQQTELLGHAVRATYLYAGITDLYMHTGDDSLLSVSTALHRDLVQHKIYINGGCGALYDGVSPSGYAGDNPNLQRTHQSFGRSYELPNITAYNETCATVGSILWNWRLLKATGEAQHADLVETSMYNLILASVSLDGRKYFYSNMLRRGNDTPFFLKWSRTREEYLSSFCCPPNMMRLLAESAMYAYLVGSGEVATAVYGESEASVSIEGLSEFKLHQSTEYPYDGDITIRYEGDSQSFIMKVRIPSWVKSGKISLPDGSVIALDVTFANCFIPVDRLWRDGDEIVISFDMPVRKCLANPHVETDCNHVALMKGPLLYCMEECDQVDGVSVTLGIHGGSDFKLKNVDINGYSVPALVSQDGRFLDVQISENGPLYEDYDSLRCSKCPITLIPYFAWDNRRFGIMKIWLPLYY